jgi:hypothetical protein
MTTDRHDESRDLRDAPDSMDPALDRVLRRADRGVPAGALDDLEARILSAATFPLAARRRDARTSMADTLAAWVRVALPLAAAAAIFAVIGLTQLDGSAVADAELRDSDPAALLSALETDGSSGLAHHLIASNNLAATGTDGEAP